ncbi:MAG: NAD(P)-binding protein [Kiritimatiellae bacterium]|nr:NAD(P)-binding protein [Kiritimatiellia bacterium]
MKKVIVAGAGIWGCTLARRLAEAGREVLVLEKRPSIGGNARCAVDPETGVEIHLYGSHIFHTHDAAVWKFARRFTEFNGYQHKVLVKRGGKVYHLPLGLTLVNKFFGVELAPPDLEAFLTEERRAEIFDAFFRGYTGKQWGRPPESVDPSVIRRVPTRANYDTNYFNDLWQGIPADGYGRLFERLLDHPAISVECNRAFSLKNAAEFSGSVSDVFYSGPIDELFSYKFGALPWRSLRFETETIAVADFQGTSVVNYADAEVPFTRIHEFKHYHPEGRLKASGAVSEGRDWGWASGKTVVTREYPVQWRIGDEPYYPVNDGESARLFARYREEVAAVNGGFAADGMRLTVGGRLGGYRYFDMDQAMADALQTEIGTEGATRP